MSQKRKPFFLELSHVIFEATLKNSQIFTCDMSEKRLEERADATRIKQKKGQI